MKPFRQTVPFLLMLVLLVSSSSCMQGPREKLVGRWYTSDTSIRFRSDGTVVYNSPRGLAVGRYFFDETPRDITSTAPHPNLILELVRKDQQLRLDFEVEILSQDRIRLTEIRPATARQGSLVASFKVLKRATEAEGAASPSLAAVPASR